MKIRAYLIEKIIADLPPAMAEEFKAIVELKRKGCKMPKGGLNGN
jgi:hypothetical protein